MGVQVRNSHKFIYSVALFMSLLIITIPFYTSSVFAAMQGKVTGQDGIVGYTKDDYQTDDITYQVLVDPIPANATVTVSQIFANNNLFFSDPNFCDKGSSCTLYEPIPGVKKYNCTCTDDWTPTGSAATFTFYYDSDASLPAEASSAPILVRQDYLPPIISNFQLSISNSAIEVAYTATDKACTYAGCTCTGVGGLEIKDEKGFSKPITIIPNPRSCTATGTFRFNYTGGDGNHNFTLKAVDRMWKSATDDTKHAGTQVKSFTVDVTPPQVQGVAVTKGGFPIGYISPSGSVQGVDVTARIKELSLKSATINLGDLGGPEGEATCILGTGGVYNCTVSGVSLNLPSGRTSGAAIISAEDTIGNKVAKNVTLSFNIDRTAPVFRALVVFPSVTSRSKTYIGGRINISAAITEAESGLAESGIALQYAGALRSQPDNCTVGWICSWYNFPGPNMPEGSSVSMIVSGKDIVGNVMTGATAQKFYVDSTAPQLIKSSVKSTATGVMIVNETIIKKGDAVEIEYNFTDRGAGVAYFIVDLSQLMDDDAYQNASGSCSVISGMNYTCSITTPAIKPATETPKIKVIAKDAVLNQFTDEKEIIVYGVSPTAVNCFDIKINDDYILPIEVNTLKYFPGIYYEVVPFKLEWSGECDANTEIYKPTLVGSCSGGSKVNIASQKGGADISGFFQFAISPAAINPAWSSIKIGGNTTTCALHYFDLVKRTLYTEPEIEPVNFTIALANDLIPPDKNLEAEIEKVREDVDTWLFNLISTINDIMVFARAVCRLKTVIAAVTDGLVAVRIVLSICIKAGGPAALVCTPIDAGVRLVINIFGKVTDILNNKILAWLCGFVTCDGSSNDSSGKLFTAGFCSNLRTELTDKFSGQDPNRAFLNRLPSSNLEVAKKSMIFSVLCMCVPGIVYNIEKYRQIECWKGLCYREYIQMGVPFTECEKQYSYQKCVYMGGQVTAIIDLVGISGLFNFINNILQNPAAYAWVGFKIGLREWCGKDPISGELKCLPWGLMETFEAYKTIEIYVKSIASGDYWKENEVDWCDLFLEPYKATTTTASSVTTTT